MTERWKPTKGEMYFYISNVLMVADDVVDGYSHLDEERIAAGNCFATYNEAEAAAEKVKKLLLSLHEPVTECNRLPKLTTEDLPKLTVEVFDRSDFPKTADYAVVNKEGGVIAYTHKPYINEEIPCWGFNRGCSFTVATAGSYDSSDWQNSLIERPAVLPDWCKVGEWCYCGIGRNNYTKIKKVLAKSILAGEYDTYTADFINSGKVLPARLRPYNADEMRSLVGKVVNYPDKSRYFIISCADFCTNTPHIYFGETWHTAEEICNPSLYQLNGKPCGKLEHLENGEWVE